ncbi:MAG: hypothetical protein HW416_3921 [Chloroflexi bacterium]|nr:hypothetical protein [Chloroflexota bacterium]
MRTFPIEESKSRLEWAATLNFDYEEMGGAGMRATRFLYGSIVGICLAILLAASAAGTSAGQIPNDAVRIDTDDVGGVVTSTRGPEAGVWVIAETADLATKFVRIVVTDDQGRYVVPDLPKANYNVWVRGYGLVDSRSVQAAPGLILNLSAVVAPSPRAAAEYYPANYWYSLLRVPGKSEFPGTGPSGNGIAPTMRSQGQWVDMLKTDGCHGCHQIGDKASREIPKSLGVFPSSVAAWERRLQSGQDGATMIGRVNAMGKARSLAGFADWTDRIAAGEMPPAPPRPQGVERRVVITMWDWATPQTYFHDEVSTDRRTPTVNASGPVYGVHENGSDFMSVMDPVRHTATQVPIPVRIPDTPYSSPRQVTASSVYWGDEVIWNSKATAHSAMIDAKGRVWMASRIRPADTPAFCRPGSDHPSAKVFPIERSGRQVSYYDPKTGQFTLIDTCFGTHHLLFAEDANNTLWFSGGGEVVGWLNTKMFEETGDEAKSQGWTALILDTNGNGKRDAYVEPDQPLEPTKDKRLPDAFYSAIPSPVDGSIWGTVTGFPGAVVRLNPGSNPPATALAEIYEVRHRSQRGRLGVPGEWTPGELRPTQVQGPAQRADSHGAALSRGLDAASDTGTSLQGRDGSGQRRLQLLQLGRSVRHAGPGEERADCHRQRIGLAAGARGWKIRRAPSAVSARLPRQGARWPDRRPEGRLEGQGGVVALLDSRVDAHRGR